MWTHQHTNTPTHWTRSLGAVFINLLMSKNHLGYRYLLLSLPSVWCINLIAINFLGGYRTLHIYTYTYIERLFFFCIVFWAVKWKFFSSLVVCDAWIAAVPFGAIVVWLTVQSSFLWRCACEWTARKFWTHSERTYDDVPRIFVQYNPPNIIHTRVLRVNESVCVWVCNRSCTALNFKHNCIVAQAITAPIHLNALEKDSVCVCAFYTYFFFIFLSLISLRSLLLLLFLDVESISSASCAYHLLGFSSKQFSLPLFVGCVRRRYWVRYTNSVVFDRAIPLLTLW